MNTAKKFLDLLTNLDGGAGRLVKQISFPGRPGVTTPWPAWVHPQLKTSCQEKGITEPWQHQVQAAQAAHEGAHTVIATGTGSGKSLAAWMSVLTALENSHATNQNATLRNWGKPATALYLSPTKALAADQLQKLTELSFGLEKLQIGIADGDTPRETKDWVRANANLILTNPDYLHHVILPGNQHWARFLGGLKYVVIDEMHYWRGITGSHIALVMRRLLRLAHHYGANPTCIFLSATVADPAATAAALIGVPVIELTAVTEDTSFTAGKELILWQPGWQIDAGEIQPRRVSATAEAAKLTAHLMAAGARLLTFVRSRAAAESVAAHAREILSSYQPQLVGTLAAYRGGYLPAERRDLEQRLRDGRTRGLVTTNALELGIDISGLDATITVGWPGTRASLWQQIGRSGRGATDGVSLLVAADNPLDNYVMTHPEVIFEPVEAATLNPTNPYILTPHLCAAAAELPLTTADATLFGLESVELFMQLAEAGYLRQRPTGWFWNVQLEVAPHTLTELRGEGGDVQVVEAETGRIVGTVAVAQADAIVHPGAIYIHQGVTYQVQDYVPAQVEAVPRPAAVALVTRATTKLRTVAGSQMSVQITENFTVISEGGRVWTAADGLVTWRHGATRVVEQVTDFDTLRLPALEFVGNQRLNMPARVLDTRSTWFELDPQVAQILEIDTKELPGALHACEHAMIAILPLLATCDRWDLGGLSTVSHEQTLLPTVFVHDAFAGGAGFTEYGFANAFTWVEKTLGLVSQCPCDTGCPGCVQSPKCGNKNNPLFKSGAIKLLEFLLSHAPGEKHA